MYGLTVTDLIVILKSERIREGWGTGIPSLPYNQNPIKEINMQLGEGLGRRKSKFNSLFKVKDRFL